MQTYTHNYGENSKISGLLKYMHRFLHAVLGCTSLTPVFFFLQIFHMIELSHVRPKVCFELKISQSLHYVFKEWHAEFNTRI